MRDATIQQARGKKARRAGAAVELAMLMPVMTLIVLACFDFGRVSKSYIAVTGAARAGAGFATAKKVTGKTRPKWRADVTQVVVDEMSQLGTPSKVVVSDPYISNGREVVKVTVEYPFTTTVSWPGIPKTMTLQRDFVMRNLRDVKK